MSLKVQSQPRQIVLGDPISKIPITKKGLVEWLKVKALSSNPSITKKEKEKPLSSQAVGLSLRDLTSPKHRWPGQGWLRPRPFPCLHPQVGEPHLTQWSLAYI
jgi:hypothetical protein